MDSLDDDIVSLAKRMAERSQWDAGITRCTVEIIDGVAYVTDEFGTVQVAMNEAHYRALVADTPE